MILTVWRERSTAYLLAGTGAYVFVERVEIFQQDCFLADLNSVVDE